ncbi:O-methyltransferase [Sandaracinobacteroides hominis]|uniref:O-methyltransferase n=1 Tax=Sandaracinobacteroides hominis TaxID=2780086 RepID=UPI0018F3292E|nr:O-methyltransferase [Sandaracinobacteroides hominis]
MTDRGWEAVDAYIAGQLLGPDPVLDAALKGNAEGGLPAIDVSAAQGKMLHLLARISGARHILEVGTLGGFSTIWLARALPEGGRLVTLEISPTHAEVARANIAHAGLAEKVEVRVGPALESLKTMGDEAPFDLVFIDADKENNANYVQAAIGLSRPGALILVDNVVRGGGVIDAASTEPRIVGTRKLFEMLQAEERLEATAIQTVGAKGWDGFVMAVVKG